MAYAAAATSRSQTGSMPDPSNYYALLQVREDATGAEIKRAYRTLAQTVHPDCVGGDAQQFRQIAEAYEVLGDPSRRRRYDAMRRDPLAAHLDPSAEHANGAARPNRVDDAFGSLFTDLFQREKSAPAPSLDVEAQVRLSFDQALQGGKTEVRLPNGKLVRLTVPRGVRSQARARIRGYGNAHPERPNQRGDLYVTFRVDQSPRFRREGDHLHVTETVTAPEAMTGTMRSIQNAYGRTIRIQIPPGTQPGERLRLRGQGVETEDGAGDLLVEIRIAVPRHLTPKQHRALESCFRDLGLL
jgi:DnaJ-class molecular chaperone